MTKKAKEEIERKWLLKSFPDKLTKLTPEIDLDILQAYPLSNGFDFRIRQIKDRLKNSETYYLTVKENGYLARKEWEEKIPIFVFEFFLPLAGTHIIHKIRTGYRFDKYLVEVDVYQGPLEGLMIAEVEFKSKKATKAFVLPDIFADTLEVTDNLDYKNRSLAFQGLPTIK